MLVKKALKCKFVAKIVASMGIFNYFRSVNEKT